MTNQDDWATFCKMMAAAGWEHDQNNNLFFKPQANRDYQACYSPRGTLTLESGKPQFAPHWREWLAAGQTPPPF